MTHPRRRSDEPPPEPDLGTVLADLAGIARRAGLLLDGAEQVIAAARDGLPLPEGLDRRALALIAAGLRHTGSETAGAVRGLDRIKLGQVFGTAAEAFIRADERQQAAAAAPPARRRHAHRKPGRGQLELIPGGRWKAPAVSGAAAMAAFRHAATAKGAAITTTAAAAAAVVTIGTSGFATLPQISPAPAAAHAQAFAGLAPTQALPVMPMTPSPLRPYVPRHAKPRADAATATLAPPPPAVAGDPSSSAPSAQPSDPAYGTLNVATVTCAIGLSGTAQIVFTAVGGALQWHASSSSGLSLSSDGGILGSGQSASLTVSVSHGTLAGAGSVTIWAGGQQVVVPVTWVALPGLGL